MATVLVGHVTKDGSIAGPRVLEHLVDVVLPVRGRPALPLRMVRAVKNRYGPTDEVGCFELDESGIAGLADPSGLFLSRHRGPGAGHRRHGHPRGAPAAGGRGPGAGRARRAGPPRAAPPPASTASGVAMVLAVLERRCRRHDRPARTSTPRPSAACASPSPPPTWPSRWPLSSAADDRRCRSPRCWSARSAWPARSARGAVSAAGWPRRPGSGFTTALVPAGTRRRARPDDGARGRRPAAGPAVGRPHGPGRSAGEPARAGVR